jgi:hypothetical protein
MKKAVVIISILIMMACLSAFTIKDDNKEDTFSLENLIDYQKKYATEELEVCASNSAKTYMDYRMTTVVSSRQYQFIHNELTIDYNTGFLVDDDGFIAVALGSYYGQIGDRFYFTLDSGIILPLVKAEEKADVDTDSSGCYHLDDSSVMEFVIDDDCAAAYFGSRSNGLVLDGNYNNYYLFSGDIVKVERVLDEYNDKYVTYSIEPQITKNDNIFNYASGY